MPGQDVAVRLEHRFHREGTGELTAVYLHNTETEKPLRASREGSSRGVITNSFQLVFSTVKSAQDIFKAMLAKEVGALSCISDVTSRRSYIACVCVGRGASHPHGGCFHGAC